MAMTLAFLGSTLALLLAAPSSPAAPGAPPPEAVRVSEAAGEAAIAGDPLAARAAAKDDALRSCVQQVATTIVTAATETDQAQLLSDRVYAHSAGYVRRFEVLEDREAGNVWTTRVRCEVSEAKLDEDLLAFGIAYRRAGMPRVLVLVAEQAVHATQASGWWQGGGNVSDLRVVENAFMDRMEKSGFTFVDAEVLQGKVRLEAIGADPNVQQAREIGVKSGAEVVVVGRAIAKPFGEMKIDDGVLYSAVTNVSARAVRTDTGEVIAAAEFTTRTGQAFEQTTAGRAALSEAGRHLARELFSRIGKVWVKEQSGTRRVAMAVRGVDDYARLAAFKGALLRGVRGVKDVQERSMEDGRAELEVTLAGTTQSFASDLATRKLQGFLVKVRKVTQGAVEVELK
jgi:hypothetical protein